MVETRVNDISLWKEESAIWTSDVDFWQDEIQRFQGLIDTYAKGDHDDEHLKRIDHLQNIIIFYGKELLVDLKSKVFHHREHLDKCTNGSLEALFPQVEKEHTDLGKEMVDIEGRMKDYRSEVRDLAQSAVVKPMKASRPVFSHCEHIVIPTDFSPCAQRATDYALSLFGKDCKRVTLLHIHTGVYPKGFTFDPEEEDAEKWVDSHFSQELDRIQTGFPHVYTKVSTEFIIGDVSKELEKYSMSQAVDLLVMGTRGAEEDRWPLGTHTTAFIRSTPVPVLVIPDEAPLLSPEQILFATDLQTVPTQKGLWLLEDIVKYFAQDFHLIHIASGDEPLDSAQERSRQQEYLEGLGLGSSAMTHIQSDDVLEGLEVYVKDHQVDLIVSITHHDGFLSQLFSSSTTKRLVLHSHIPILVLHAPLAR